MPVIIPEGFAQVTMFWGGAALVNGGATTFGLEQDGAATPALVAAAVNGTITTALRATWGSTVTYLGCRVKFGPNDTGPFAENPASLAGTGSTVVDSPNTALLTEWQTGLGGRRGRGRMYWPVLSQGSVGDSGNLTPSFLTTAQTEYGNWFAALVASTSITNVVVLHGLGETPVPPPTVVTAINVDGRAATQRRRLRP